MCHIDWNQLIFLTLSIWHMLSLSLLHHLKRKWCCTSDRYGIYLSYICVHSQSPAYPSEIVEYPSYNSLSMVSPFCRRAKCSVLPEDRCHIGRSALQTALMTASSMPFWQSSSPLIQDLPEHYPYHHRKNMPHPQDLW